MFDVICDAADKLENTHNAGKGGKGSGAMREFIVYFIIFYRWSGYEYWHWARYAEGGSCRQEWVDDMPDTDIGNACIHVVVRI